MDGEELVEAVRDARATELDRLQSERALVAETGAVLEPAVVLSVAAAERARARDTLRAWADDEPDARAREAFAAAADRAGDHYDLLARRLDDEPDADPDPVHEYLRGLEGTPQRVGGGLVGRPLVESGLLLQVVSFFVNEADAPVTDLARELRGEVDGTVEEGASVLDAVCEGDDWERAREAAETTVETAYDEYAERLEGMGLDPKPVC